MPVNSATGQNVFKDRQAACFRCGIRSSSHGSDDVARGTQQKSRQKLSADETGRAGDENRPFGTGLRTHRCVTFKAGNLRAETRERSIASPHLVAMCRFAGNKFRYGR